MRCKEATTFIRQTAGHNKTISGDYHPFFYTNLYYIYRKNEAIPSRRLCFAQRLRSTGV